MATIILLFNCNKSYTAHVLNNYKKNLILKAFRTGNSTLIISDCVVKSFTFSALFNITTK